MKFSIITLTALLLGMASSCDQHDHHAHNHDHHDVHQQRNLRPNKMSHKVGFASENGGRNHGLGAPGRAKEADLSIDFFKQPYWVGRTKYETAEDFEKSGHNCGTRDTTPEEEKLFEKIIKKYTAKVEKEGSQRHLTENPIVIPTYIHIVRPETGSQYSTTSSGDWFQKATVDQMNHLNAAYSGTGFQFQLVGTTYTRNDAWYEAELQTNDESLMKASLRTTAPGASFASTLNIYTKDSGNGVLGWATPPDDKLFNQDTRDGVVIEEDTVPQGGQTLKQEGDILVHEVGHWLGLKHTFQGGCDHGGDSVTDTPAQATPSGSLSCIPSRDTCPNMPGLDPVNNYMDYSRDDCMDSFTPGQIYRMQALYNEFRDSSYTVTASNAPTSAPTPGPCQAPGEEFLKLMLTLDNFPSENDWTIVDECSGNTLLSGGPYSVNGETIIATACASPSTTNLVFTLNDSYGDGLINSNSGYRMYWGGSLISTGATRGISFSTLTETLSDGSCPSTGADSSDQPSIQPSATPSSSPSVTASNAPTLLSSNSPSELESGVPSAVPSNSPSQSPSKVASGSPTVMGSGTPTDAPSTSPSGSPSKVASGTPTVTDSGSPTDAPSTSPSNSPSKLASGTPTVTGSGTPTDAPSASPSGSPSKVASGEPTEVASGVPSHAPSISSSLYPSIAPSQGPTGLACPTNEARIDLEITLDMFAEETTWTFVDKCSGATLLESGPYVRAQQYMTFTASICVNPETTQVEFTIFDQYDDGICCDYGDGEYKVYLEGESQPVAEGGEFFFPEQRHEITDGTCPGSEPSSDSPSASPSKLSSDQPSVQPSSSPSSSPSKMASNAPTLLSSSSPTQVASGVPSAMPSNSPSDRPSKVASAAPTVTGSGTPTDAPSTSPSGSPSKAASGAPTVTDSSSPTDTPSISPSDSPSKMASSAPSLKESGAPSDAPTTSPSGSPSWTASDSPTVKASSSPTLEVSSDPTSSPSAPPTGQPTEASNADLIISEVFPNPGNGVSDKNGEFIEIYNPGTTSIFFGGDYVIRDNNRQSTLQGSVGPGEYFVVCRNAAYTGYAGKCDQDTNIALRNKSPGETVTLLKNGQAIDSISYVDARGSLSNKALHRQPGDVTPFSRQWVWGTATIGDPPI